MKTHLYTLRKDHRAVLALLSIFYASAMFIPLRQKDYKSFCTLQFSVSVLITVKMRAALCNIGLFIWFYGAKIQDKLEGIAGLRINGDRYLF